MTLELYHVSAIYAFPYLTLMKIYTNTCSHRESVLAAALGLLAGDELVPVHGHRRLALPPVSRLLVKLLPAANGVDAHTAALGPPAQLELLGRAVKK